MNRFLSLDILKNADKFFPDLHFSQKQRFVNYVSLNLDSKSMQWKMLKKYENFEYLTSKAILKGSFGKHILDWDGVDNFVTQVQLLQKQNLNGLLAFLFNCADFRKVQLIKKVSVNVQRRFYIMTKDLMQEDLFKRQSQLKTLLNIQKIIVTPSKIAEYSYSSYFQQFCKQHNVKVMPIKQWSLLSFNQYLYSHQKHPVLIHQLPNNDTSCYQAAMQRYRAVPNEIYMFCHLQDRYSERRKQISDEEQIQTGQNYIQQSKFTRNYVKRRQPNQYQGKQQNKNFLIKRYIHKKMAQKLQPIIQQQKRINSSPWYQNQ